MDPNTPCVTCENVNYIKALMALLVGQVIRPAYRRLLAQHFNFTLGQGQTRLMIDPDGFAQLEAHCDKTDRTGQCRTGAMNCVAMILLNKGGRIADITVDDSVEFAAAMRVSHRAARHVTLFYTLLFEMGILGDDAPPSSPPHDPTASGQAAPNAGGEVIVDIDGVLVSRTRRRNTRPRPGGRPSVITRCSRSSPPAGQGPASPSALCCGRGLVGGRRMPGRHARLDFRRWPSRPMAGAEQVERGLT